MRLTLTRTPAALTVALVVGCAHSGQRASAPSVAVQAGAGQLGPGLLEWTGKFRSVHTAGASGTDMSQLISTSGSVRLTAPGVEQTRVELTFSGPSDLTGNLRWAIAPGACRSDAIPLMPVNAFPNLRVSDGRGELDQVLPIALPTAGSYHVNVYAASGADESDVVACAPLQLQSRRDGR